MHRTLRALSLALLTLALLVGAPTAARADDDTRIIRMEGKGL